MIPRRLTAARKVVSRIDPAWRYIMHRRGVYGDYCSTLDMAKLGDIGDIAEPFTVFEVLPLRVAAEPYVETENHWEIFAQHVRSISGITVEFELDGGRIKAQHRDEIGPDFVKDIASMIVQLANADGVSSFFTLPVGSWEFIKSCQAHLAREAAQAVLSAGATRNE